MSKDHKKVCMALNYIEHLFILVSAFNRRVSFYAFASLVGIPICITSSTGRLKICAAIKKYKSIIIKKKKKHNKIALLVKTKRNTIGALISRALINSYINHDEFVLVNNVLRKYSDMKEEIKNLETSAAHQRF